jgi:hypothetical protein
MSHHPARGGAQIVLLTDDGIVERVRERFSHLPLVVEGCGWTAY